MSTRDKYSVQYCDEAYGEPMELDRFDTTSLARAKKRVFLLLDGAWMFQFSINGKKASRKLVKQLSREYLSKERRKP